MPVQQAAEPNLTEHTLERLRKMILCGDLAAGTPLQERAFAERLGVSRTPLREAITRLITEGLVTRSARGTPTVSRISVSEIVEILHVRRLLECEAARQAASVNSAPEDWLNFKAKIEKFLVNDRPDAVTHADFDFDLHMHIAKTAGSKLLAEMIQGLKLKTRIFDQGEIPSRFEPGAREHLEIIDAILARDPDAAEAAMRRHIENAREAILAHIHRLS
jgi:DNA-binding GntR family transcriptional regulator